MKILFKYDPSMEIETLKVSLGGSNNPSPTRFGLAAQEAKINFESVDAVMAFVNLELVRENLDIQNICKQFSTAWSPYEVAASKIFKQTFETTWDPGEVTAYLTIAQRCPYNVRNRYYFVSITTEVLKPIATSLHELQHFYSHAILEPLFIAAGVPDKFNEFKEALTVILNYQFNGVLSSEDMGYPQHKELREWILKKFKTTMSVSNICKDHLKNFADH